MHPARGMRQRRSRCARWPAAAEPAYWRQLRDYQIAAEHFYRGDVEASAREFAAIGKTAGHPMQELDAYLALRSRIRAATLAKDKARDPKATYRGLAADAQAILADARLANIHEAVRASLRTVQYRLLPAERFAELSALLDDPKLDPHAEDHLGDWRRLANDFLELSPPAPEILAAQDKRLRAQHAYYDWMRSLQRCGYNGGYAAWNTWNPRGAAPAPAVCTAEYAHAVSRWQAAPKTGAGRAWLTAALMLTQTLDAKLERAALDVPAGSPEYLTLHYNLARLYRLRGDRPKAIAITDAALGQNRGAALGSLSGSANNLLRRERFVLAAGLEEAGAYLLRKPLPDMDRDTGQEGAARNNPRPSSEGLAWLNARLSIDDLLRLAELPTLGPNMRERLLAAAWSRAELLGKAAQAENAAGRLAGGASAYAPLAKTYLAQRDAAARRHAFLLIGVRNGLSPLVASDGGIPAAPIAPEEASAGMWCALGPAAGGLETAEQAPQPPDASADPKVRDIEQALLAKLPTATGFLGEHVLQRARTDPKDPDLPWLLYVVVRSTRGGCLDPGATKLSKSAHALLRALSRQRVGQAHALLVFGRAQARRRPLNVGIQPASCATTPTISAP
ncbi:MAG: hypothetical protein MO847_03265 [Candidatus Protistobacter heckmanni]|nr:hypothetical protein [Candidatus Protistobacter heckmanni]